MKRIIILVALLVIAGLAGIVRSHTKTSDFDKLVSRNAAEQTREETRQTYELAPGASVELSNINGAVKIETADTKTAEVLIERFAVSQEALGRRKVTVEADANSLRIQGEKGDVGFFERFFGSNPSERVTLKLPRQIALHTKGVNGSVMVGDIDGSVDVHGVNGRVQIAGFSGQGEFKGINGNVSVGVKQVGADGLDLGGINGNIELQLADKLNADIDVHGINGSVSSDLSDVMIDRSKHGRFTGRIGAGGSSINAKGINGNVRFTRVNVQTAAADEKAKE
ncbi:MAG TPA: hypothetical protein VI306_04195 [Pyrinomonadaceae bacterium]